MNRKNEKKRLQAHLGVHFKSSLADHEDVYFCKINVWREADLFPATLRELVWDGSKGSKAEVEVSGKTFFDYLEGRVFEIAEWQFSPPAKMVEKRLRLGRFYPLGYFRGLPGIYAGNPFPGRVIDINAKERTYLLDANHPLGRIESLTLKMKILEVEPKDSELGGRCRDFCELAFHTGPGMQARYDGIPTDFGIFEKEGFARQDETPDTEFYREPRLTHHIVRVCHSHLAEFYRKHLKGRQILDLMSSFESHLPEGDFEVIGLGINAEEMKANSRLSSFEVKDLNLEPILPFESESFDAVVCDLSIEYVIHPLELMKEVHRVLKPGGQAFFSFSNRYFPPKVIRLWIDLHEFERMGYVLELFKLNGGFKNLKTFSLRGYPRPVDDRWFGVSFQSDPLYVVWGEKEES
jgi:SAM-dependent methyltransferase